jgi:hypothetical protein
MPGVEHLSVVEGPLNGLPQESPACGLVCSTCSWFDSKGVSPTWMVTGLVISGWKGAFGAVVGSWLYRRVTQMPTDSLMGVGIAAGIAYLLGRR